MNKWKVLTFSSLKLIKPLKLTFVVDICVSSCCVGVVIVTVCGLMSCSRHDRPQGCPVLRPQEEEVLLLEGARGLRSEGDKGMQGSQKLPRI